ncbi:MAG: hypothetical protein EBY47_03910 [Actinobacteria bacterium]|nr:hypothetical protein [Actinomycetota bacterium]
MSSTATDIRSAAAARTDPAQPYVTYLGYDGRMELSGASVINAAAKIANALTSEFDCDPGQQVALHLPWHWQRVTWLLGIWSAGCVVVPQGSADCDLLVAGPQQAPDLTGNVIVVSMHPFGLPLGPDDMAALAPGAQDATIAVRTQPDQQVFIDDYSDALALDGHTQRQLLERARDIARPLAGVTRLGLHPDDSQWWLPALWPAVTGGSVILGQSGNDGFGSEPVDAVL